MTVKCSEKDLALPDLTVPKHLIENLGKCLERMIVKESTEMPGESQSFWNPTKL